MRDLAGEFVVRESYVPRRSLSEVVGDFLVEVVVVEEEDVEGLSEDLRRDGAGKRVVTDIQEGQAGVGEHRPGELAGEFVVADVELVEVQQRGDFGGDGAGE